MLLAFASAYSYYHRMGLQVLHQTVAFDSLLPCVSWPIATLLCCLWLRELQAAWITILKDQWHSQYTVYTASMIDQFQSTKWASKSVLGYVPLHVGMLPDQLPSPRHFRYTFPNKSYPELQKYFAKDPGRLLKARTLPFLGARSFGQVPNEGNLLWSEDSSILAIQGRVFFKIHYAFNPLSTNGTHMRDGLSITQ